MVTRASLLLAALTACSWTTFDDLADSAWVHSHQRPGGEGTEYAVLIANAGTGAQGGTLAVVSNQSPSYSTIVFDPSGATKEGANPQQLGNFFISALDESSLLLADPASNQVAIVTAAVDTNQIAVAAGAPDNLQANSIPAKPPQAAVFAGGQLWVIAADANKPQTNLYNIAKASCVLVDETSAQLQAVAAAADATNLWVWSRSGVLLAYPITSITACLAAPGSQATPTTNVATQFTPGTGARIHLTGTKYAILAAHRDQGTTGSVFIVDTAASALVGQPLVVDGVRSSAVGALGDPASTSQYVALGLPDAEDGGHGGGRVELYAFDATTGALATTKAGELSDAQPESGQQFGRSVAIMTFNGKNILVVGAKSELFAYYRTLLYPDTRN